VCIKDTNYYIYKLKAFAFISSFALSATVIAQAEEPVTSEPEQVKSDAVQPEPGAEAPDLETTIEEAMEEYEIYKKQNPEDPCDRRFDTYNYETSWYDETQAYVNSGFCEPALWFDNFFGSDRVFNEGVAGTYIRWRNDFSYDEEEYFKFKSNLSFSVELPGLEQRLRLTFESGDDEDLRDIAPGQESTNNTLGLQLDVKQNERSKFNVSISLSPRVRLRYRYTYPVFEDFLIRFTQEVQNEEGVNSARTRIDFEKAFVPKRLFRATTEGVVAEDFPGLDWSQAFALFHRLSKKSSVSYEIGTNGITRPDNRIINTRVGIRYRRNIHRDWLFFELTPDITWPLKLSEDRETVLEERHSVLSLIFRLEIHFSSTKKRKYSDYIY